MTHVPRTIAGNVTVVVPTMGGAFLQGCLESIARGTVWPARLVVIDQGRDEVVAPGLPYCNNGAWPSCTCRRPRRGSPRQPPGLREVRTGFAAVTHDDCRVRHDWLERLPRVSTKSAMLSSPAGWNPRVRGSCSRCKPPIGRPSTRRRSFMGMCSSPRIWVCVRLVDRIGRLDEHPSLQPRARTTNGRIAPYERASASFTTRPSSLDTWLDTGARICLRSIGATHVVMAPFTARGFGAVMASLPVAQRATVGAPWLLARGLITRNSDLIAMGRGEIEGLLPGILAGLKIRAYHRLPQKKRRELD